MRVVSLNCSNTEIVHALGMAHALVGVDDDSDWPPDVVTPLPKVGRDLDVRIPDVRALEPDLVLASITVPGHEQVVAGLAHAGPLHRGLASSLRGPPPQLPGAREDAGCAYDFSTWMQSHPGGAAILQQTRGSAVTALLHS